MKVLELTVNLYVLEDIHSDDIQSSICDLIDRVLIKDDIYNEFHKDNKFKNYVFDSLVPFEIVHTRGSRARFKIRTVDEKLAFFLKKNLVGAENKNFLVLTVTSRVVPFRNIESIRTITPVTLSAEKGYWRNCLTSKDFEDRLISNLLKKYNSFTGENIECCFEDVFVSYFEDASHVKRKYKNKLFLTDRLTLILSDSEIAQKLAYFALGSGILEKNSRGFGFMQYTFSKRIEVKNV